MAIDSTSTSDAAASETEDSTTVAAETVETSPDQALTAPVTQQHPDEQTRAPTNRQDPALASIENLIANGRVRTALEQLDRMREEDITNERVNALIEEAVRTDRDRELILSHARLELSDGWTSNINNSAREIVGEFFIEDQRVELTENLNGGADNLRLNSFLILRQYSRSDFAALDLLEFHRLNMVRINNYRNRGQPFDWAVDFFLQLSDESHIQQAITALETVLTSDSVQSATAILRECQETIDSLKAVAVPTPKS